MPTLSHATTPVHQTDRSALAERHEREIRRLEEMLRIQSLSDTERQRLQVDLLRIARTAHHLRTPLAVPSKGARMKSFVGLDPYYFNG